MHDDGGVRDDKVMKEEVVDMICKEGVVE